MNNHLTAAALFLLCGCSTTWTKPGATAEDYRVANAECNAQAMAAVPPTGLAAIAQKESVRAACLEGKGWVSGK